MRVGFDARWYNDSGVGNYVAGLLPALAECADGIEIVAYEDADNQIPGLEHFPMQRIPIRSRKYSLNSQVELARRCHQDKLDIFHSPFYVIPFAAPCPVITTVHDLIPFLFTIYSWPKQWMVKVGYRAAALRATHVIAVSDATARDVRRVLGVAPNRVSIVHNAVSRRHFHSRAESGELSHLYRRYKVDGPFVVICSPRNWRTKNLATAFEAVDLARAQTAQKFQTVVYGPRSGRNASSGRADLDVIQTGFIPSEDLGSFFRHARVFLLTSFYEGFGLPLLEAMSCGCPVVTSNGGSLAEVAGEGAQVFDPLDAVGMAKAIARLLDDSDESDRWRARALARASQFCWKRAAEQTAAVYRLVCNGSQDSREMIPTHEMHCSRN